MNQTQYELIIKSINYSMPAIADELCNALNNLINEYNKLKENKKEE